MFKIGYMEYANVYPIFYYLLQDKSLYFFKSYPAELNIAMRKGEIDLSPASCIEYARNPSLYNIIPDISVSSIGAVKSVNIFSNYKADELDGKKIFFTKESNTSTVLSRIILEKFYKINPIYVRDKSIADAELLIGDKALYSYYNSNYKYIIDLGLECYKFTNLLFLFALWIIRKSIENSNKIIKLINDIKGYAKKFTNNYNELATKYISAGYTTEQIIDYWNTIDYRLTSSHIEGLKLFYDLAYEIKEIGKTPKLNFY